MLSCTRHLPLALVAAALAGCAAPAPSAAPPSETAVVASSQHDGPGGDLGSTTPDVVADLGGGAVTPASIGVRVALGARQEAGGFGLLASVAGQRARTVAEDLVAIKFYLVESTTGSTPASLAGATGVEHQLSPTELSAGQVTIRFTNVRANGAGKSYYVAAAAFDATTYLAADNITNLAAPIADATQGRYFRSTSGGDGDGGVRVEPVTYALNGTAALGVPLPLLDAVSPELDAGVTVSDGQEIAGAPQGSVTTEP